MFGRKPKATIHIPSVEIPSIELGGGRLPTFRTPEIRTPDFELPRVDLPSVELGGLRIPHVETPELRIPRVDFELLSQPPFVRRRRTNPIVRVLKFGLGLGVGLLVGVVVAALLAPAAGEDTRRRIRELASGDVALPTLSGDTAAVNSGAVREGVAGLLSNPKGRFQVALEEARKERASTEAKLMADFQTAQRTGENPG
jgi:gas vesicle protein